METNHNMALEQCEDLLQAHIKELAAIIHSNQLIISQNSQWETHLTFITTKIKNKAKPCDIDKIKQRKKYE